MWLPKILGIDSYVQEHVIPKIENDIIEKIIPYVEKWINANYESKMIHDGESLKDYLKEKIK